MMSIHYSTQNLNRSYSASFLPEILDFNTIFW